MENIFNTAVIWFVLGFVFLLLEFIVPGLILAFFAIGAWIVAIVCLVTDISINTQLVLFLATSVLSILFFRKWASKIIWLRKNSNEIMEDEFLGKTAIAESFIGPGQQGKVAFKGTTWDARSEDSIAIGENVTIIGNDSIVLFVKLTTSI